MVLLEEVLFAVGPAIAIVAFVRQLAFADVALQAVHVEEAILDFEDELIENGLRTSLTLWNFN